MAINNFKKSYKFLKKSIELTEEIGRDIIDDEYKAGYYTQSINIYEPFIFICLYLRKNEEAFEFLEKSKSKAFIDLMSTSKRSIKSHNISTEMLALLEKEETLLQKKRTLQMKKILSYPKINENTFPYETTTYHDLKEITKDLNNVYYQMEKYDPNYVSIRRPKAIELKTIKEFLKTNSKKKSILVEYFIAKDKIFLFVITPNKLYVKRKDLPTNILNGYINNYKEEVINFPFFYNAKKQFTNQWMNIRDYLIDPIKEYIKNIDLIYLVPYGVLHHFPLHSLLVDHEPLIKNHAIIYLPGSSLIQFYKHNYIYPSSINSCKSFGVSLNDSEKEFIEEAEVVAQLFGTKRSYNLQKKKY